MLLAICSALIASCAEEQENATLMQGKVTFKVADFVSGTDTRIAVDVTNSGAQFMWTAGDTLGVFPDEGFQTAFPISDGSGTSAAEFDGGKWALRSNAEYAAYYPFMHPMDAIDKANIAVAYTGQCQTGNNSTAHLGSYDFLAAPFTSVSSTGNTTFNLAHMGALVRFRLYVPAADTFSRLTLTSDGAPFVTSGTIDLLATNPTLTPTATNDKMTLYLSGVSSEEADDLITLYVMIAPADQSNAQISVRLSGTTSDYIGSVTGKKMQAGTIYGYSLELEETELLPDDPAVENPIDNPVVEDPYNGHAYVDLGFPSKTLWATCNVGAEKPEDYGYYYAWGETEPKDSYLWSTYKHCEGTSSTLTKYCNSKSYGKIDNKKVLDADDDAAVANWGGEWRMPTSAEWQELYDNTTVTWMALNGVYGCKFTSLNGNSIFLPASGYRESTSLGRAGSYGFYWSSSLDESSPIYASYLQFITNSVYSPYNGYQRHNGFSVRPVCPVSE